MIQYEQHTSLNLDKWLNEPYNGKFIYTYLGSINSNVISDFFSKLENSLKNHKIVDKPKRALYVAIELTQNIYHHAQKFEEKENFGGIKVIHLPNGILMEFLNLVNKDQAMLLSERIQQLNILTKEELKRLYMKILSNYGFNRHGGGNLGLIDVTRKLLTKLHPEFYFVEKNLYFYLLKVYLN
ncbi:MAG: DUF6272 family protein [Bacteroidales bacterium]|nr:DUF6272 family protein [Bacteroidales bacterium]